MEPELEAETRGGSGADCTDGEVWSSEEADGYRESRSVLGVRVLMQDDVLQ